MSDLSESPNQVNKLIFRIKKRLSKSFLWGSIIFLVILAACMLIPAFSSVDPNKQDLKARLAAPSATHLLGTDNYGRDILIRILYGGQIDIEIAVIATLLSLIVGTIVGLWAGYFGGWVDTFLMRMVDITLSFPMIVLVIAIVSMLGTGIINMYIAILIISWVYYARLTRGECMVVKNKEFVTAARAMGASSTQIIFGHIFPNVVTGALIYAASDAVLNIIFAGTLGYLGLGVQAPTPEWGSMVAAGQGFLKVYPGLVIYPSLAIILAGVAFSLIGDGAADMMRRGS
jgi:peptide/nickel transport system permease protein